MANTTGKKFGGRQKGTPNKTTASVKEAMQLAFEGIGGVPRLQAWAAENPDEFYKLWAKLIPTEVKTEVSGANGAPFTITWQKPSDE